MSEIKVVAAIILKDQQVLIAKRPVGKHKAGYWEFPGGKIEQGETDQQALKREIQEELAIQIKGGIFYEQIQFSYPEKKVCLKFYVITQFSGEAQGMEGQLIRWVQIEQLKQFKFPEANLVIVEKLMKT